MSEFLLKTVKTFTETVNRMWRNNTVDQMTPVYYVAETSPGKIRADWKPVRPAAWHHVHLLSHFTPSEAK